MEQSEKVGLDAVALVAWLQGWLRQEIATVEVLRVRVSELEEALRRQAAEGSTAADTSQP